MKRSPEDRLEQIVSALLRGKRLGLRADDAEEKGAIIAAARLAAARQGEQRMSPGFRKRLAGSLAQAPQELWLTRRAALVAGFGLAAGVAAGGIVGRSMIPAPQGRSSDPIEPVNGSWHDVAAFSDLKEGQGMRVSAGGVGAYLFRSGDTVSAVSSVCSHLPCELWWNSGSALLDCPCHPASFTAEGRSTTYSNPLPSLNAVHVRITAAGRVEVLGTA
ncbi:MAG: ubiquinol-cytochrome c reductase iron-sulfur subunit [Candidatus Dormibacterales bacterium]